MTERDALRSVLEDAQRLGFLGRDPVERHIEHAILWAGSLDPAAFLDLGSGGGIPGLVFALQWPTVPGTLLDGQLRRTAWLRTATSRLELSGRVTVLEGRAEDLAHTPDLRERFPLVVARSFGPPSSTAECASGFLTVGGVLTVSEPPGGTPERWPTEVLATLGLDSARRVVHEGASFVILPKSSELPDEFPRRRNLLVRSPLW